MIKLGIDQLLSNEKYKKEVVGNIAFLGHMASVNRDLEFSISQIQNHFPGRLKKLFGPQHGLQTTVQDNMIETSHQKNSVWGIPIYSLYSDTREPTPEMLEGIDTVIVDLQDVGCRIYTYIYTMAYMLRLCAKTNKKVIVLDRPNPIDGVTIEGHITEPGHESFVGLYPIPVRHGMTIGELSLFFKDFDNLDVNLFTVPMDGWSREMLWSDTNLKWVNPSPNMPDLETALLFPGTVLFEGITLSEGRGTTLPLKLIGDPSINPFQLDQKLNTFMKKYSEVFRGISLRPTYFFPEFQKHAQVGCGGYQFHLTERNPQQIWKAALLIINFIYHNTKIESFWRPGPYEYEYDRVPFDVICGSLKIKRWIESGGDLTELKNLEKSSGLENFTEKRENFLLYR